jgi:phosphoglycerate dehydrogenase-like enzyme
MPTPQPLTIWCNANLPLNAVELLKQHIGPHRLIFATKVVTNLVAGAPDPVLEQADVAYGQPDPQQVIDCTNLKWVHLSSAGYTRYDTSSIREALRSRSAMMTNSSSVYDAPCAEHLLALILAHSRRLPQAWEAQHNAEHPWPARALRGESRLLYDQIVLIYGYGSIARRLVELFAPLRVNVIGVRRSPRGDEGIRIVTPEEAETMLGEADHVINVLPAATDTLAFFNATRFAKMKPTGVFYNVGRGDTVDQYALEVALTAGRPAAAYIDVTTPEPLPPDNALWRLPNCIITPHTAGGHATEFDRGVRHFLDNLHRYTAGHPLINRVV